MQVATIISVSQALHDAGVRFLVCGGQAVVAHGYVRFTAELDIAIHLDSAAVRNAVNALKNVGYRPALPVTGEQFADPKVRQSWAREKNMTVLSFISDADPLGTIDVFIQNPFDFDAEYAAADRFDLIPDLPWRVLRVDALIDKTQDVADGIAKSPGDGTYAGARKLYLARGLSMTLIERLRAVEDMAETARFVQEASSSSKRKWPPKSAAIANSGI